MIESLLQRKMSRDYKSISTIIQAHGQWGSEIGYFRGPKTVAIEKESQNILVADGINSRIQVFDPKLKYITHFPHGDEYVGYPWGLYIQEMFIFVTDKSYNRLFIFNLDGILITFYSNDRSIGRRMSLKLPHGIAIDSEYNAYVCDSVNQRLLILHPYMPIAHEIQSIIDPIDVKLHNQLIIVLVKSDDSLIMFDMESRVEKKRYNFHLQHPEFLHLDFEGNILISDAGKNQLCIFNWEGNHITDIKGLFTNIKGIAVNKEGYIINVCEQDGRRFKKL